MATLNLSGKFNQFNLLLNTLVEINKLKGHGLAYELNFAISRIKKELTDYNERFEEVKKSFLEKDENGEPLQYIFKNGVPVEKYEGQTIQEDEFIGFLLNEDLKKEAEETLRKFNNEVFVVEIKELSEKKLIDNLESGILDGIDLTIFFEFNILK